MMKKHVELSHWWCSVDTELPESTIYYVYYTLDSDDSIIMVFVLRVVIWQQ